MEQEAIHAALREIAAETDATLKSLGLASLCSAMFRDAGVEIVVVCGSAIEFYTEGAYTSGDLDLCLVSPGGLSLRRRQELMGKLQAEGGPRSWRVAGLFVDLLGHVENFAPSAAKSLDRTGWFRFFSRKTCWSNVSWFPRTRARMKRRGIVPANFWPWHCAGSWKRTGQKCAGLRRCRNTITWLSANTWSRR